MTIDRGENMIVLFTNISDALATSYVLLHEMGCEPSTIIFMLCYTVSQILRISSQCEELAVRAID